MFVLGVTFESQLLSRFSVCHVGCIGPDSNSEWWRVYFSKFFDLLRRLHVLSGTVSCEWETYKSSTLLSSSSSVFVLFIPYFLFCIIIRLVFFFFGGLIHFKIYFSTWVRWFWMIWTFHVKPVCIRRAHAFVNVAKVFIACLACENLSELLFLFSPFALTYSHDISLHINFISECLFFFSSSTELLQPLFAVTTTITAKITCMCTHIWCACLAKHCFAIIQARRKQKRKQNIQSIRSEVPVMVTK